MYVSIGTSAALQCMHKPTLALRNFTIMATSLFSMFIVSRLAGLGTCGVASGEPAACSTLQASAVSQSKKNEQWSKATSRPLMLAHHEQRLQMRYYSHCDRLVCILQLTICAKPRWAATNRDLCRILHRIGCLTSSLQHVRTACNRFGVIKGRHWVCDQ